MKPTSQELESILSHHHNNHHCDHGSLVERELSLSDRIEDVDINGHAGCRKKEMKETRNELKYSKSLPTSYQCSIIHVTSKNGHQNGYDHVDHGEAHDELVVNGYHQGHSNGLTADSRNESFEEIESDLNVSSSRQHLHALHRFRRLRKRASDRDIVIGFQPRVRTSIVDRKDFFYRYGDKEKEALMSFDFLDAYQCDINGDGQAMKMNGTCKEKGKERDNSGNKMEVGKKGKKIRLKEQTAKTQHKQPLSNSLDTQNHQNNNQSKEEPEPNSMQTNLEIKSGQNSETLEKQESSTKKTTKVTHKTSNNKNKSKSMLTKDDDKRMTCLIQNLSLNESNH